MRTERSTLSILKKCSTSVSCVFLVLVFLFTGCQSDPQVKKIPENNFLTQEVQQSDDENFIRYTLKLPENWVTNAESRLAITAYSTTADESELSNKINALPYILYMDNYLQPEQLFARFDDTNRKLQSTYTTLFEGDSQLFEAYIRNHTNFLMGLYGLEIGAIDEDEQRKHEKEFVSDLNLTFYAGQNGKIAVANFAVDFLGQTYQGVWCVREDIPYMTVGFDDGTAKPSSADIALAVLDCLQVEENFTVDEDGLMHKIKE